MSFLESLETIKFGNISLYNVLYTLILLIICIIVVKIILGIFNKTIEKTKIERSLHTFIKSLAKIILYFIAVIIIADSIGIPITSLIAVLSIAGLAVSLAVQDSLSNIANGITILVSKPFVVGDFVEINGVSGTVCDIGLIHTKLIQLDNKTVYMPNGKVSSDKIINYTKQDKRRIDLNFCASYDESIESVKAAIMAAVKKSSHALEDPAPFVAVSNYKESSIEYVLRVWVKTSDYWDAYFFLMEEVKHAFDENGVSMTYNHLNVHMIESAGKHS